MHRPAAVPVANPGSNLPLDVTWKQAESGYGLVAHTRRSVRAAFGCGRGFVSYPTYPISFVLPTSLFRNTAASGTLTTITGRGSAQASVAERPVCAPACERGHAVPDQPPGYLVRQDILAAIDELQCRLSRLNSDFKEMIQGSREAIAGSKELIAKADTVLGHV